MLLSKQACLGKTSMSWQKFSATAVTIDSSMD
jgi:hypothetical protein